MGGAGAGPRMSEGHRRSVEEGTHTHQALLWAGTGHLSSLGCCHCQFAIEVTRAWRRGLSCQGHLVHR